MGGQPLPSLPWIRSDRCVFAVIHFVVTSRTSDAPARLCRIGPCQGLAESWMTAEDLLWQGQPGCKNLGYSRQVKKIAASPFWARTVSCRSGSRARRPTASRFSGGVAKGMSHPGASVKAVFSPIARATSRANSSSRPTSSGSSNIRMKMSVPRRCKANVNGPVISPYRAMSGLAWRSRRAASRTMGIRAVSAPGTANSPRVTPFSGPGKLPSPGSCLPSWLSYSRKCS